jgi:hypothetical protein
MALTADAPARTMVEAIPHNKTDRANRRVMCGPLVGFSYRVWGRGDGAITYKNARGLL